MRPLLYITACLFLILAIFAGDIGVSRAAVCPGPDCEVDLGGTLDFQVVPKDENGDVIIGVEVSYNWVVNPGILGTVTSQGVTGADITVNNSLGASNAVFTSNGGAPTGITGTISVTVTYGGVSLVKTWNLTAFCNRDPVLYYGIGAVKDSGENNWHQSTAEVLETCYTEYKLYGGTTEGY